MSKIKHFTDLIAWRKSHKLIVEIYKITKFFPKEEIFGLTSQIRRCAVSISFNIAEGVGRKTNKDKINFYHIALGSLNELQNQLLIARDIDILDKNKFNDYANKTIEINKLINGLIKLFKSNA